MDVALVLVFLVVFLCSFLVLSKPKGLPPGPLTFPVVGSYFFLKELRKKKAHLFLYDVSKKYGNIFSFRIGTQLVVVLHGYDTIHQALVKQSDVFSDRPNFLPGLQRNVFRLSSGIIFRNYTHQWKTLRRFTLQTLRDLGVGKTSIEEKIAVEIDSASKVFDASCGETIEIWPILQKIVGNVIYGITFGTRFDFDDPNIDMLQKMANVIVSGPGATNVTLFLPRWLSWMVVRKDYYEAQRRRENGDKIRYYILDIIKQHEESYDESNIRDFVDLYIKMARDSKDENSDVFSKTSILQVIVELFIAGTETTFNTLNWAFLFMSEYPEIQQKCFNELEDTVGDKHIEYADRVNLPYIEATIAEIQRHANILPISVQHCTAKDTTLLGYKIPKKTIVMPSLYSANLDPKYWNDPRKFFPERFIDSNGKFMRNDALVPFSTGPRMCLGEPLARIELFLVFSTLLQRFTFERETAGVKHSMELKPNQATSAPYPYNIRIKARSA